MKYSKFMYLYPPRPEFKTNSMELDKYDNGEYIAQPKYNGSCCIVFTNGSELHIYNRHKQRSTYANLKEVDFKRLAKSKNWYVFAGEYLNKGKIGESGVKEKDMFVMWDCLVWNGEYLVGKTLKERLELLEQVYPCKRAVISDRIEMYEHLCCTEIKGVYKAPTYLNDFSGLYNDLIKTDLYEGVVLKKINSKLTYGLQELNNNEWQIKCRKETKLYNF